LVSFSNHFNSNGVFAANQTISFMSLSALAALPVIVVKATFVCSAAAASSTIDFTKNPQAVAAQASQRAKALDAPTRDSFLSTQFFAVFETLCSTFLRVWLALSTASTMNCTLFCAIFVRVSE